MDEEDTSLPRAFHALVSAARSSPYNGDLISSDSTPLPDDILRELCDVFGSIDRSSRRAQAVESNAEMWQELAKQGVPLGSVVQGLVGTMEKGGRVGLLAADVYLGFMLAPGCPLYSLFTQTAFNSLLRCVRNSCKPVVTSEEEGTCSQPEKSTRKGKGNKRKGKRGAQKPAELEDEDEDPASQPIENDLGVTNKPSLATVLQLLGRLRETLNVFHFKEHQDSLRSLIELLVELPHLASEMQTENDELKPKRAALGQPSSQNSASTVCYDILKSLLETGHGDPMNTAVLVLKILAPSILLTRSGGNSHQRSQIRDHALRFVTSQLKKVPHPAVTSAIIAFPRYLAMKAPEKTEPRALAVDSVMMIVKILPTQEQRRFGYFVAKLSRGKPRHRLFAIDLAVSLLSELPDPLGLDKGAESDSEECNISNVNMVSMEDDDNQPDDETVTKETDVKNQQSPEICHAGTKVWWGNACLEALLHRCSDKIPAIRARALSNLAQTLEILSSDIRNRVVLQSLLGFGTMAPPNNKEPEYSIRKSALLNSWNTPGRPSPSLGGYTPSPEPSMADPGASPLTPGAGHGDLGSLLRRRCLDDKVAVRKSTLLLMSKSASLLGRPPDGTMLEAMGTACADAMVSIRKTALAALSEMMRKFPADNKIVTEWFQSALPLVMDNESSIQEECLTLFEELVIDRISTVAASRLPGCSIGKSSVAEVPSRVNPEQELDRLLPPGVLVILKAMADDSSVASCVKRVCTSLGKKKKLRAGIVLALQNIITASRALWTSSSKRSQQCWTAPAGAWLLLAEVSGFIPKAVGWEFLRTHWQLLEKQENINTPSKRSASATKNIKMVHIAAWAADRVHLLQTISNVAVELPAEAAADLAAELLERLEGFNMEPTEVGAHVKALHVLCIRKASSEEEGDGLVSTWVEDLLEKAGRIIDAYVSMLGNRGHSQNRSYFETPKSSNSRRKSGGSSGKKSQTSSPNAADPVSQIIPAIFTVGALVLICPKTNMNHLAASVQALIASTSVSKKFFHSSEPLVNAETEHGVLAQAWVTLGKMCLANHDLAKKCIPLFLQEFEKSDSAPVRNNIMIAMTDFCVRYTSLIDGYIHKLSKSLRDSCELVRRQGFVLLAQLLQRDYVKWRGTLFHRFLLALVDESEKVRRLADFLFSSILKTKAPLLAYNSFVEAIFILNDCHAHAGHAEILHANESERKLFSLRGNAEPEVQKRMHIYECLLKQMVPEHLLATSAKLCADILAAAADGMLNIDDPTAQCVLEDSLKILASKEMRIGGNRGPSAAANESLEVEEDGAAAFAAAKGRVVTQLAKRNLVQNAIPIFIELKRLLESKNSPLTGMLMECMRVMLKEYKNEIEEILVADKQLQREIMYDMQKHEAAKAKAKVVAAANAMMSPTSALRQRNTNAVDAPNTNLPRKSPAAEIARRVADGKENFVATSKGKGVMDSGAVEVGSGRTSKRKTFLSPESSRVRWLDQTPEVGANISRSNGPLGAGSATTPIHAMRPMYSGAEPSNSISEADQCNMASAVANVVAEATAAAVLSGVARGTPTGPLQAMSLPRLHPTVPSTVKKASFLDPHADVPIVGLSQQGEEVMASFQSVRRRQSFSSIDVPGSPQN